MAKQINVALIGNPNTGKTSVFNILTGLNQKVGNYPGITVEKIRPIDKNGVWSEHDQILALSKLIRLDFGGDLETMLSSLTIDLGI